MLEYQNGPGNWLPKEKSLDACVYTRSSCYVLFWCRDGLMYIVQLLVPHGKWHMLRHHQVVCQLVLGGGRVLQEKKQQTECA